MSDVEYRMINSLYLAKVVGIDGDGSLNSLELIEAALSEIRLANDLLSKAQLKAMRDERTS